MLDVPDTTLRCDVCDHGAAFHGSDGCEIFRCRCSAPRARFAARGDEPLEREVRRDVPMAFSGREHLRLRG